VLQKAVLALEEQQAGRPAPADTLRKAAPAPQRPEPPARPQAVPKPTPAPSAPLAPSVTPTTPPTATRPTPKSDPTPRQEVAFDAGEDGPYDASPRTSDDDTLFEPRPTGHVDNVQTFQTEGEGHQNCKCHVVTSPDSPAVAMVHPNACPKCRAGAQAFNEEATQAFEAGSQPGASECNGKQMLSTTPPTRPIANQRKYVTAASNANQMARKLDLPGHLCVADFRRLFEQYPVCLCCGGDIR
jgi:hypothetical protein